jgi:hypothetical protein
MVTINQLLLLIKIMCVELFYKLSYTRKKLYISQNTLQYVKPMNL